MARRKTAVSNPSRNTATNAIPTIAMTDPVVRAVSVRDSRSVLKVAAWRHPHDHVGDPGHGHQGEHTLHGFAGLEAE